MIVNFASVMNIFLYGTKYDVNERPLKPLQKHVYYSSKNIVKSLDLNKNRETFIYPRKQRFGGLYRNHLVNRSGCV